MNRTLAAARLHVLNKWLLIWVPLIVIGAIIAATLLIRVIMLAAGADAEAAYYNPLIQALGGVLMGCGVLASTRMFPFAFAMSLTRRAFTAGTLLVALGVGVGYGLLCGLLAWCEHLTGGWWVGSYSLTFMGYVGGSLISSFVFYAGIVLFLYPLGLASAMLWKRFRGMGLVIAGLATVILLSALVAWAAAADAWVSLFGWVTRLTPMAVGGYTVAAGLLLGGAFFLMARHAEP